MGRASRLQIAVLRYGGNWNGRPAALRTVLEEVGHRTSILVAAKPAEASADQEELFRYPLLWMMGDGQIEPFSQAEIEGLRRHLSFGGTLVADDTSGQKDSAFARSLAEELRRILPAAELEPLPSDHAVFRSYYYVSKVAGRTVTDPRLKAISIDDRAAVIFSPNDLSGALERDTAGNWKHAVQSADAEDRTLALRLAVNLVVYSMTVNYKLDQVHIAYRLSHPGRYPRLASPAPASEDRPEK